MPDSWQFAHVNDTHMGTARSYRFRPSVNQRWAAIRSQLINSKVDLLLHGGDLTRDGDTHEFEYQQARHDIDGLPFPSFIIPGNMDVGNKHAHVRSRKRDDPSFNMTSERLRLFSTYFGPLHWTFMHRNVRFTGFYAALAGSGLHEEEQLWSLLNRLASLPRAEHHVAMMHYWLYMDDIDEPTPDITDPDQYFSWYFSIDREPRLRIFEKLTAAGVNILFSGHVHTGRPVELVDGMRVYKTPAGGNTAQLVNRWPQVETRNGYHLCTVSNNGIDVRFVPGDDQEPDVGTYGPWGHPTLTERDYSIAQEIPPLQIDPWLHK